MRDPGKAVRLCNPEINNICAIEFSAFGKVTVQTLPVYYGTVNALMFFCRPVVPSKYQSQALM